MEEKTRRLLAVVHRFVSKKGWMTRDCERQVETLNLLSRSMSMLHRSSGLKGFRFPELLALALGLMLYPLGNAEAITYEQWAVDSFGSSDHPDSTPEMDPDNDGISNLREYAFMGDPKVSSAESETGGIVLHTDNKKYFSIEFLRRADVTDLIYEVRSADSPADLPEGTLVYRSEIDGTTSISTGLIPSALPSVKVIDVGKSVDNFSRRILDLRIQLVLPKGETHFVTIGDPGNAPIEGAGAVSGCFQMSRFETTNAQYVEFLNAIAKTDHPEYPVFNGRMGGVRGGVIRTDNPGSYSYAVKPGLDHKPVASVEFWSACRYCNWLANGKPSGAMTSSTTEDGSYDLTDSLMVVNNLVTRKPGALYFIPTLDEWFKAAYYDPTKRGTKYWHYGTASDTLPTVAAADLNSGDINNDSRNIANYNRGADWDFNGNGTVKNNSSYYPNGTPSFIDDEDGNVTTIGSGGPGSYNYYGAADMTGNVSEWTETSIGTVLGGFWGRIESGNSWKNLPEQMGHNGSSGVQLFGNLDQRDDLGFRVARAIVPSGL